LIPEDPNETLTEEELAKICNESEFELRLADQQLPPPAVSLVRTDLSRAVYFLVSSHILLFSSPTEK
jgi:hypothetical protein